VRSDCVVVLAPLLDDNLCFLQTVEDLAVEQLIAELTVEGFAIASLITGSVIRKQQPCGNRSPMASLDTLLKLAADCFAHARLSSNPLTKAELTVWDDDYLKRAEKMRHDERSVVQAAFPKPGARSGGTRAN
jgi:hypothetical protein